MTGNMDFGATIGIIVGSIVTAVVICALLACLVRILLRGPLLGSQQAKMLDGRVVAITGANTGIGRATALDLAMRGARVILLCRNEEKARKAAAQMKSEYKEAKITVLKLDLASLRSVRACAQALMDTEEKIDILVNNAGLMMCPDWKTEDGFDMQFGTNHLGHFLLTELITPLLIKSAMSGFSARIVNVSSSAHFRGQIHWQDVHFEGKTNKYDRLKAYNQSKLANVMHARELAHRLQPTGVTVVSLHPGIADTDLYRFLYHQTWYGWLFWPVSKLLVKNAFYGAQTSLYCCLNDDKVVNGAYYSDCRPSRPSLKALDDKACKKLWDMSERMTGLRSSVTEML